MHSELEPFPTRDISRLRVGIGPKPEKFDLANFVLSNFPKAEQPALDGALNRAVEALEVYLKDGLEKAMNRFN